MFVNNHLLNIHFVIFKFIYPYFMFLKGAAYSIQQILVSAGLQAPNFSNLSPSKAIIMPLGGLCLYSIFLAICCLIAGYAISRIKGILIAVVIVLAPGIISVFGYWLNINFQPKVYRIGYTDALGSPNGMATVLIISLISGWSIFVVATDIFSWQDRFRHLYDHLWYAIAIIAAGWFFVSNNETSLDKNDLRDTTKYVHKASVYLLGQVREYSKYCMTQKLSHSASCVWANSIQQTLVDYSNYGSNLYWEIGPKSSKDLYMKFGDAGVDEGSTIRSELKMFNQRQCPSSSNRMAMLSNTCQSPPVEFCSGASSEFYILRTVAVSNECVIPTLVKLRTQMEKQSKEVKADYERSNLWRWLFFIFIAFLGGGKIANSTAKLTKTGPMGKIGLGDKKNTVHLISYCLLKPGWFVAKWIYVLFCRGFSKISDSFLKFFGKP